MPAFTFGDVRTLAASKDRTAKIAPSNGILHNWLSKFKQNGYNVVEKKKGRKPKSMTKLKKNDKELSEKEKIKKLEEENLYLKAENEYLKKLRALVQERELKEKKK